MVSGFGFWCGASDSGFGVWGLGLRIPGFGFWDWGFGYGVWGLGFRVRSLGFGVSGMGFRFSVFVSGMEVGVSVFTQTWDRAAPRAEDAFGVEVSPYT